LAQSAALCTSLSARRVWVRMARYCFYCGRQLTVGERCTCQNRSGSDTAGRTNATGHQASSGSSSGTYGGNSSSDSTSGSPHAKAKRNWRSFRRKSPTTEPFGSTARPRRRYSRLGTWIDQVHTLFPNIFGGMKDNLQFFLHPATKIRKESLRTRNSGTYWNFAFASILTGILFLLMSRSGTPMFRDLAGILLGTEQSILYSQPIGALAILSAMSFLLIMALSLSFFLAARVLSRRPTFRKVMDLVSISLVYLSLMEIILTMMILLGSRGSILLLLVGCVLMALTHMISFRSALGLSEDSFFFFLIIVYFCSYILCKFILSLTATVLSRI